MLQKVHLFGLCGFFGPFLQFWGYWGPQNGFTNVYHIRRYTTVKGTLIYWYTADTLNRDATVLSFFQKVKCYIQTILSKYQPCQWIKNCCECQDSAHIEIPNMWTFDTRQKNIVTIFGACTENTALQTKSRTSAFPGFFPLFVHCHFAFFWICIG